jgi:chorismate synthase
MFTTRLRFLTAGESHGPSLTAILEGLPAGLSINSDIIDRELSRRQQGYGAGPRMKTENDHVEITGGVMGGITIGSPLSMRIVNLDHEKWRRVEVEPFTTPRPGHADLTGTVKYGYSDIRPALERASARETAARVGVGAVCKHFLSHFGIQVFGYVRSIGSVTANLDEIPLEERGELAEASQVRCPDLVASEEMQALIRRIMDERDTVGGIIEAVALHLPPGLGSHVHWDRKLGARLGGAILGIQAVKGVEFGSAFDNTRLPGTKAHDAIRLPQPVTNSQPSKDQGEIDIGELVRPSNRAGGLEGGITTGQPLIIRSAMKPIATTLTPQQTVDLTSGEEVPTRYERSDFCPVPRAVPIIEAVVSFILADALIEKLGGDSIEEMLPRFSYAQEFNFPIWSFRIWKDYSW